MSMVVDRTVWMMVVMMISCMWVTDDADRSAGLLVYTGVMVAKQY